MEMPCSPPSFIAGLYGMDGAFSEKMEFKKHKTCMGKILYL
jgi:hypothetical protein